MNSRGGRAARKQRSCTSCFDWYFLQGAQPFLVSTLEGQKNLPSSCGEAAGVLPPYDSSGGIIERKKETGHPGPYHAGSPIADSTLYCASIEYLHRRHV